MKKIILGLFVVAIAISLNSCQNTEKTKTTEIVKNEASFETLQKGFDILESNCFTCHSPQGSQADRIAPPMIAVKKHYIDEKTNKEEFVNDIVSFVLNPNEGSSKMPGAIEKFNLMPQLGYSKEQLTAVAEYLYETEIEQPEWFQKHYEEEHQKYTSQEKEVPAIEQGQKLAMQTKSVLGKNLMGTIKAEGTDAALEFCNIEAFPLIDSMSTFLNAKIKRVSDKPRNENHMANAEELEYILAAKNTLANNETVKGAIKEVDDKMIAYYPITTNTMCLQCHGATETQIKPSTMNLLSKLYPKDKATGYGENELRGIWVVEFDN